MFYTLIANNNKGGVPFASIGMPNLDRIAHLELPKAVIWKSASGAIGLYARRDIRADEVVTETPIQVVSAKELPHLRNLGLDQYCFDWRHSPAEEAFAFGAAAFLTHSSEPNCNWKKDFQLGKIDIVPRRDIFKGEPISIDFETNYRKPCRNLPKSAVHLEDIGFKVQTPKAIAAVVPEFGRGLIAAIPISRGEVIVEAPVRVVQRRELPDFVNIPSIVDYAFEWGTKGEESAICLGLPSMVNHGQSPTCYFEADYKHTTIKLVALTDIPPGQEIIMDYSAGDISQMDWSPVESERPNQIELPWYDGISLATEKISTIHYRAAVKK